ncbi:MAG: hypothetical protein AB7O68_09545 [Pirellulales bacterium]
MTLPAPTTVASKTELESAATSTENFQSTKRVDSTNILSLPAEDYAEGVLGNVVPLTVFRELMSPLGDNFRLDGVQAYRKQLRAELARPGNQLDSMLVDQLAWCHVESGHLLAKSAHATDPKEKEVLSGSAVKLMAEVRRTAQALRELQTPREAKQVTVVKQQNVAAGDQQVAYVETRPNGQSHKARNSDTKLVSNGGLEDHERLIAVDSTATGWTTEPSKAEAAVACSD